MEELRQPSTIKGIIEQIKSFPPPKTEESILLRVLVQTMVIVGIIATDVAARGESNTARLVAQVILSAP